MDGVFILVQHLLRMSQYRVCVRSCEGGRQDRGPDRLMQWSCPNTALQRLMTMSRLFYYRQHKLNFGSHSSLAFAEAANKYNVTLSYYYFDYEISIEGWVLGPGRLSFHY